jgi:CDP-diacylglycerol--glycerol-3-phosphate 3-phosphatidyltransferase
MVKHLPNVISVLRTAGSFGLLFCDVTGWPFWVLYALCGISDTVDGRLARKLHTETKSGAVLDSVADIVFVAFVSHFHRGSYCHLFRRAGGSLYQN